LRGTHNLREQIMHIVDLSRPLGESADDHLKLSFPSGTHGDAPWHFGPRVTRHLHGVHLYDLSSSSFS
jgi:hypothetical protein